MSELSDTLRKFERIMGHSHDELMEIGRHSRPSPVLNEKNSKTIALIKYNPEKQKIEYTPINEYKKSKKDNYNKNSNQ